MFGFRGRRTRNIKVGSRGPTLHTGPRRLRVGSAFCDTIGEFLHEICSAVLFKYGGYPESEFREGVFGKYFSTRRCTDPDVKGYIHSIVRIARTAMKQNQLLAFEVAVVDGNEFPLCTLCTLFRKRPHFRESALWQNRKEQNMLIRQLGRVLQNIQKIPISEDMYGFIETTATRLRIRLQLDETFRETAAGLDLIADSPLPQPWHTEFVPIGDPITNLFNQMYFSSLICEPPNVEDQDERWNIERGL